MDLTRYDVIAKGLIQEAAAIETAKRPSYTIGSPDVLANFKRIAERTGLTPGQVLTVYMLKHIDSITSLLCKPELTVSEAALGRFADAVNYLKLGYALYVEGTDQQAIKTEEALPTNGAPSSVRASNVPLRDLGEYGL